MGSPTVTPSADCRTHTSELSQPTVVVAFGSTPESAGLSRMIGAGIARVDSIRSM